MAVVAATRSGTDVGIGDGDGSGDDNGDMGMDTFHDDAVIHTHTHIQTHQCHIGFSLRVRAAAWQHGHILQMSAVLQAVVALYSVATTRSTQHFDGTSV